MEREVRASIVEFPSPRIVDGSNALKVDVQFFPQQSFPEQNLISFEEHRNRRNPLAEIIDHFDLDWKAEGLPWDWYRLSKIDFSIDRQMGLLKGTDYDSKALWTTQTRMDLLGYVEECLRQGVVFPFKYDKFDGVDFVNTKYGKRMTDTIDPKERGGAVKRTTGKMKNFLKEKEAGAMAIMVSPAGETGLIDDNGDLINHKDCIVFTLKKVGEGLEGIGLRTDFNSEEAREIVEIYTGIKLSTNASIEEYMEAILIEPEEKEEIENLASKLRGVRQRNQPQRADIAYDPKIKGVSPKTWQDMFYQLSNRDNIYDVDRQTTAYIYDFDQYVLSNNLSMFEIIKALAATTLRISRHFFIIEDDKEGILSIDRDDYITENVRPGFTYGDAYDMAAERPGCVGGGSSSGLENLLGSGFGEKRILCCKCPFCGEEVEAVIADGKITCPNPDCKKSVPYKEEKAA